MGVAEHPQDADLDGGTQPAALSDLTTDSVSTMRPMATQAVFRPHFGDDEDSVRSEPR